uniref:DUF3102 domain-containing protein n=1 Tax=Candidatus Kentrum sp. LFY TaxID=2126342 RepID=A0A450WGQ9_9GAMM|nr:MAG: hypothetical protein BECKLFY1418C_GA0070996_10227 [Candidatus Kentron sp. LFY]
MGRHKIEYEPIVEPVLDEERLAADLSARDQLAEWNHEANENATALATQLGYEGSMTLGGLEDEIRFYQKRTVEACIELGKRLLILKELTPHGEFGKRVELLGVSPQMARKFMGSTLKFSKRSSTSVLKAAGSQTKLLELLVLDDDEVEALEKGESVRGVTLDEVDTMSASELRHALRDSRADLEARGRLLSERNEEVDRLHREGRKLKRGLKDNPPDPVEVGEELRGEAGMRANEAEAAIRGPVHQAFLALAAHTEESGVDHRNIMAGLLGQIELSLHYLREVHNVPNAPTPTPDLDNLDIGSDLTEEDAIRDYNENGWFRQADGRFAPLPDEVRHADDATRIAAGFRKAEDGAWEEASEETKD